MGGESERRWSDIPTQPAAREFALGVTQLSALIHVVDDDQSFRVSLGRLLEACGYEVALYGSAKQLDDRITQDTKPSCILLDVRIPELTGPELQRSLIERGSTLPIVFLTGHTDISTTVQAIKSGAEDFLIKPVKKDQLLDAIERALARGQLAREQRDRLDALRGLVNTLTPRERQVFDLVVRGKLNKEIAFKLGATERTIKAHRQKVMEKMQARSVAELVLIAERLAAQPDKPR
jgi:FixJ family two-component response regulator